MKTKIETTLLIFLAAVLLAGCSPRTMINNSWRDPDVTIVPANLNKFMVAALLKNQIVRREVEDQMASLVPGKAVQSYKEFGTEQLKDNDTLYNEKLKKEGFEGVVIMRLVNVKNINRYVPGSAPVYYSSWGRYYRASYVGFYSPGYYATDKVYTIEVNVYSLKQDKLIWSGNSNQINSYGKADLFKDVARSVYKKMISEGFIK
jgi:pentatricopeptide repeat protein